MKPNRALESALTTILRFEEEIGSLVSVTGKSFTAAVTRTFSVFSDEDMYAVIQRDKDSSSTVMIHGNDKNELFESKDQELRDLLLRENKVKILSENETIKLHKKIKTLMYIPISAKKEAFLAIILARKNGRFHKHEIEAMEYLSAYLSRAFHNLRIRGKKTKSLADDSRHKLLLHTQSMTGRKQTDWSGYSTAVDYSACIGSDIAGSYRYGDGSFLMYAADITADDVERQAGLIYLDTWFSILSQTSLDARGMLQKLNTDMLKRKAECYASVTLIRYQKKQEKAEVIGCGNAALTFFSHEKMDTQTFEFGPAAGITDETEMSMHILPVKTGDIICAFTDGISGTKKRNGDLFGNEAVGEIVRKNYFLQADELSKKILSILQDKEDTSVNADDRTLQILKIE